MYRTWRGSERSWNSEFRDSELNDAAQPLEHPPSWIESKCGRKERPADRPAERPADAHLRRRCPTDDDDDSPTDDSTTYDDDY
jgi:hypothetical protein